MGTINSAISVISIDEIRALTTQEKIITFTAEELEEINHKHIQTTAGFLAVKKSLIELFRKRGIQSDACNYTLSHSAEGRPILKNCPDGVCIDQIAISISHTSANAYGLASIQDL